MLAPSVTFPSVPSFDNEVIVTSESGLLSSLTVKVAVVRSSLVLPLIAETVIPAVFISILVTDTSATSRFV